MNVKIPHAFVHIERLYRLHFIDLVIIETLTKFMFLSRYFQLPKCYIELQPSLVKYHIKTLSENIKVPFAPHSMKF